jgi:serine/threonine protein phosphatase PrpC
MSTCNYKTNYYSFVPEKQDTKKQTKINVCQLEPDERDDQEGSPNLKDESDNKPKSKCESNIKDWMKILAQELIDSDRIDYAFETTITNAIDIGGAEVRGNRNTQQDRMLVKIIPDCLVDKYRNLSENELDLLLKDTTKSLQATAPNYGGSTCILAIVDPLKRQLTVMGLGDCEAILVGDTDGIQILNTLHTLKTPSEYVRIENEVKVVSKYETSNQIMLYNRTNGHKIEPTRGIGDRNLQMEAVGYSHQPDIRHEKFPPNVTRLILACDGLLEGDLEYQTMREFVQLHWEDNNRELAQALVREAYDKKSNDNISVLCTTLLLASENIDNNFNTLEPPPPPYMMAVFDGHGTGGAGVARHLEDNLFTTFINKLKSTVKPRI